MKKKSQTEKGNFDPKLRDEAEGILAQFPVVPGEMEGKPPEDLLYELQVHQIELEMQNEELRSAQLALEESMERYSDLYDFAPVGYFAFTPEALIKEVNLPGSALLRVARQKLINARFRKMVEPKDQDLWDQHFLSVLLEGEKQTCDLRLKRQDGSTFYAGLESIRREVSRGVFQVHTAVTDITERKLSDENLRQSEERYRTAVIEEIGEGYYEVDLAGNFTFVNDSLTRLLHYSREELIGMNYRTYILPEEVEEVYKTFNRVFRTGEIIKGYPVRIIRKDGTLIFLEDSISCRRDSEGRVIGFRGISRDITERKRAEEVLKESEERYRELFNNMTSGVAVYEAKDNGNIFFIQDLNKGGEVIDQVKKEDILGQSVADVFPGVKEFGLFNVFQRVWKTGMPERISETFYLDQRISGWRENYVYKLPSGEIVTMYDDITERVQTGMLLRESEEKYRSLASTADLMCLVDRKCRYLFTNEKYSGRLDLRGSQIIGRMYSEFHSEEDTREFAQKVKKVFETNESFQSEYKSERDKRYFLQTYSPVKDQDGKALMAVTVVSKDITELKRAEEKLKEANSRLQMLQRITASVHSTLDLEEVFRQITDSFVFSMGYNSALIIKRSYNKYQFEVKALSSNKWIFTEVDKILGFTLKNYSFPVNQELNYAVSAAMRGEIVVARTAEEILYPMISKTTCSMLQDLGGIKNYILVPLKVDKEVVGGVIITTAREEVSEEEFKIINIFAQAASHAIQNANLHTLTQQAKEALLESEENFRALAENATDGIMIATGEEDWHVYANRRAAEITGYPIEELLKARLKDLVHSDELSQLTERYKKRVAGLEVPKTYETALLNKDGIKVPIEISSARTIWQNQPASMVILRDITERKQAEESLGVSREQLRALARRLQAVREEERTEIAREIHDELGGALTGLKIDLSLLTRAALKIENETVRTSLLAGMNSMIESIDSTIPTVRRIAMQLRPGVLDDLGLVAALEWQLKDFEKRTGIRCDFFPPVEDISFDAALSTALFRIFQEALTNVFRHSGATEVRVRLRADADSSTLEVEDNGKGIEKEEILSSKSLGLLGMRERAQMFGGRITVTGTPGIGTKVMVEISPVEKRKMDRDQ